MVSCSLLNSLSKPMVANETKFIGIRNKMESISFISRDNFSPQKCNSIPWNRLYFLRLIRKKLKRSFQCLYQWVLTMAEVWNFEAEDHKSFKVATSWLKSLGSRPDAPEAKGKPTGSQNLPNTSSWRHKPTSRLVYIPEVWIWKETEIGLFKVGQ